MTRPVLRTLIIASIVVLVGSQSAEAQGNWQPGDFGSWRIRFGLFEPDGDSEYWNDTFRDFTGSVSDFEDAVWGVDYIWRNSRKTGVLFGTSYFNGETAQAYRDFEDSSGFDITHTTRLELWDFYVAYTLRFGDQGSRVIPYVGAGAGLHYWNLQESGDFIDFSDPFLRIFSAHYTADGWTWGGLVLVGLDVPLGYSSSFFFEGRYRWSEDELGNDFSGFGTIDLSGPELSAGFAWNF
jgi:hypothetical protein